LNQPPRLRSGRGARKGGDTVEQIAWGAELTPELDELDKKATQRAVERELEKYRLYKYLAFDEREATVTASYELREGGSGNKTSDQTAEIAIHNVDEREKRRAHIERIEQAVNRLPHKEAFLIRERYMTKDAEYITDYHVYAHVFDPPISDKTYIKIRWKAVRRLALALGVAVPVNRDDQARIP